MQDWQNRHDEKDDHRFENIGDSVRNLAVSQGNLVGRLWMLGVVVTVLTPVLTAIAVVLFSGHGGHS